MEGFSLRYRTLKHFLLKTINVKSVERLGLFTKPKTWTNRTVVGLVEEQKQDLAFLRNTLYLTEGTLSIQATRWIVQFMRPVITMLCIKSFKGLPLIVKSKLRVACKHMYILTSFPPIASSLEASDPTEPNFLPFSAQKCAVLFLHASKLVSTWSSTTLPLSPCSFSVGFFLSCFTNRLGCLSFWECVCVYKISVQFWAFPMDRIL